MHKGIRPAGMRYVVVRFYPPNMRPATEIYDRENAADMAAWDENQVLYPLQVVATGAEYDVLRAMFKDDE